MSDQEKIQIGHDWQKYASDLTAFANDNTAYADALKAWAADELGKSDREADLRQLVHRSKESLNSADAKALQAHAQDFIDHKESQEAQKSALDALGVALGTRKEELDHRKQLLTERHIRIFGEKPNL